MAVHLPPFPFITVSPLVGRNRTGLSAFVLILVLTFLIVYAFLSFTVPNEAVGSRQGSPTFHLLPLTLSKDRNVSFWMV